jgi:hypothetical protein
MAIKNLPAFNNQLLSFVHDELPDRLMRRQIEISVHLIERLQVGNPVDTGFSRSNWRMNVDKIPSGTLGTYEKALARKTVTHHAKDRSFRNVTNPAKGEYGPLKGIGRETLISRAFGNSKNFTMTKWKNVGHVIYVFNNVPYVKYLEQGHSGQAPKGFIWIALAETRVWMQAKGWR